MPNPYESPQVTDSPARAEWPAWVKLTLWQLHTRRAAMAFVWLSLLLALACGVAAYWFPPAWAGVLMVFAAPPYWLAVRWVDKHSTWERASVKRKDLP